MECTNYSYPPLLGDNVTRILRLLPADYPYDPIHIELFDVSLADLANGRYEALSYAWGDKPVSIPISCDGKRLFITASLELALIKLRKASKTRELWIDQICINQDDVQERGEQVKIMGDIYSMAGSVLIWLGDEADDSNAAILFAEHLAQQLQSCPDSAYTEGWYNDYLGTHYRIPNTNYVLPNILDPRWEYLHNLLRRPWFSRLWIVQEVLKSKNQMVQCGDSFTPWSTFALIGDGLIRHNEVALIILGSGSGIPRGLDMILRMVEYNQTTLPKWRSLFVANTTTLGETVQIFCGQSAKDPRDYIYALLSLANTSLEDTILPDYAIPYQRLYTKFAIMLIQHQSLFKVLDMVRRRPGSHVNLPSWVPDWTVYSRLITEYNVIQAYQLNYDREILMRKGGSLTYTIDTQYDHLIIKGRVVTQLSSDVLIFPVEYHSEYGSTLARLIFFSEARDLSRHCRFPAKQGTEEIMWRTMINPDLMDYEIFKSSGKEYIKSFEYQNRAASMKTGHLPHRSLFVRPIDLIA